MHLVLELPNALAMKRKIALLLSEFKLFHLRRQQEAVELATVICAYITAILFSRGKPPSR